MPTYRSNAPHLNWLKWWPRDFDASTRGWPLEAVGAYVRLLNASWDLDGLPDDERALCSIAGASPRQWRTVWSEYLAAKFPLGEGDRLRNPRLERVRAEGAEMHRQRSEAGRKGNAARWSQRDRNVIALRSQGASQTVSQSDRKPEARSQKPEEKNSSDERNGGRP